jgi:hypothetical protein
MLAMRPHIDETRFGSITVDGEPLDHDIVIRLGGKVKKRKKKLSKQHSGSSHTVSLEEAKHILDKGAKRLIIGTGQHGCVQLSDEAKAYFEEQQCAVEMHKTPKAIQVWNKAEGVVIAMFHVTC